MKTIKNILVALDLTNIDKSLIQYASFLAETLHVENVYFVHNIKKYEISELFEEQLKSIDLDKIISDELDEIVDQNFNATAKKEVLISEDPYTESLISYIVHKYLIDLVILGNKNKESGTGIISDKLMRLLKCDIVSVPQNPILSLDNVWVGTDFSKESRKVFPLTSILKDAANSKITLAHVYNVPIQFAPYLEKEEMIPKIEKHTQEHFTKFLAKSSIDYVEPKIIRGREATIPQRLASESEKAKAHLLIIGDKGGNVFSSLLVGSVTDELFESTLRHPLWIVK